MHDWMWTSNGVCFFSSDRERTGASVGSVAVSLGGAGVHMCGVVCADLRLINN